MQFRARCVQLGISSSAPNRTEFHHVQPSHLRTRRSLPPGADPNPLDGWEPNIDGKPDYRRVWSAPYEPSSELDIRVAGIQFCDGTIANGEGDPDDAPLVYINGRDLHPDHARAIAQALLETADLADPWAGVK